MKNMPQHVIKMKSVYNHQVIREKEKLMMKHDMNKDNH